jgi:hypothetical protein
MKDILTILFLISSFCQVFGQKEKSFVLVCIRDKAKIVVSQSEAECVQLTVADLIGDILKISGKKLNSKQVPLSQSYKVYIATKKSSLWESYQIKTKNSDLYITGSDERGTMFGIYHFIGHYLGVDLMYFCKDVEPKKQAFLRNKIQETNESIWIKASIGDMLSGQLTHEELLAKVILQKQGHLKADSLAKLISPKLSASQKAFFQSDFQASSSIMIGLEMWLENSLKAKLARNVNNLSTRKTFLQEAFNAFVLIDQGMSFKTSDNKWKNWFRGDRKMNLSPKKQVTKEVMNIIH